jgi:5-(carboxyamino)imidazole ribonucleotide mutase
VYAFEARVVSAHRTPDLLFEYAEAAGPRGLKAIIAGAGGAAHLPGMLAAKTIAAGARRAGAVEGPVRCGLVALHRPDAERASRWRPFAIGEAGAANAALFAVAMLANERRRSCTASLQATSVKTQAEKVLAMKLPRSLTGRCDTAGMILPPATLGMLGGGQLGRYFVGAAHELGYKVWVLDPDAAQPGRTGR